MTYKSYKNILKYLSLVFLNLLICFNAKSQEDNSFAVIKVGVYNNKPKVFLNEEGKPEGIFIDILEYIAEQENLKIEYIQDDWFQLIEKLKNGDIDVMPDVAYSMSRDSVMDFNNLSIISSWLEVFATNDKEINSISDLSNTKIGVLKGSIQEEFMKIQFKKEFNIDYQVVTYDNYESSVDALLTDDIDFVVAHRFFYYSECFSKEVITTGIIFHPDLIYFAFPEDSKNELMKIFDKHISELKNNPRSVYYKSLQHWLDKDYKAGIPTYLKWIFLILSFVAVISTVFVLLLKYRINIKTRELKLINKEISDAKLKAEESDKLKTAFLQNMSHEIRTPMNAIIGFSGFLNEADLETEKIKYFTSIIQESSYKLLAIVNDILTISTIVTNQEKVNISEVDLNKVFNELSDLYLSQAKNKNILLNFDLQLTENQYLILTDKNKITQILSNLISNALKFTKEGKIEIICSLKTNNLEFCVKDTGIGIEENLKDKIFEIFRQADLEISQKFGGTGLGLSISKGFIELLNGKIWVESEINKGSAFYFTLPFNPVNENIKSVEKRLIKNKKFNVLIAEDEDCNFVYLQELLKKGKINVIRCQNGKEAVEIFKNINEIDLILMDIKMPVMDGYTAAKLIKQIKPEIPIIAQSAYVLETEKHYYTEKAFDDFLTKPITRETLFMLISKYYK